MIILVVDDHEATRSCLAEALRARGHEIASCESAEAAVSLLPYVDAVICDGLEYAGFAVVAQANRLGKPVVLYTGNDAIAHAAAVGRIPCVLKPGSVPALLAALEPQAVAA